MDPTPAQGIPLPPSGPAPASSSSQAPKIPIEPGRLQTIKDVFANYKKSADTPKMAWVNYKMEVSDNLDNNNLQSLFARFGTPATDALGLIDWLDANSMIRENTDELNTFIENNFREKEPDEAVQPSLVDVESKAQRREAIIKAYQEYMDVDSGNPENKIAAYHTFIDKLNEQMTEQEVKSIALVYGAWGNVSDFKGLARWLQGHPDLSTESGAALNGKHPATVKKMIDTIFPSNKL